MPKPLKIRQEPKGLKILGILNKRMELSVLDKENYFRLKKGYDGEVRFDALTEKLECECYILNDLQLKANNTHFQIDTLIISENTLYPFEVKNNEGDYVYDGEKLCTRLKTEVNDPFLQRKRSLSLFRRLLQDLGFSFPIDYNVVFINPEFTLYQAPDNAPMILPTQINRYLKKFERIPSKLNGKHKKLADQLISLHIEKPPFILETEYHYHQVEKGLSCAMCDSLSISVEGYKSVCFKCGYKEDLEAAVLQNVEEFMVLFPERKVTTNAIYEWCKVVESKRRIKGYLKKHYKSVGGTKGTYYIYDPD